MRNWLKKSARLKPGAFVHATVLLLLAALCRRDIDCDKIMTYTRWHSTQSPANVVKNIIIIINSGTRRRTSQGGWLAMMLENLVALLAARAQGD